MNLTPAARFVRTLLQVLVAVCVAIPAAIRLVPIPSKYDGYVALVIGVAAAVVVLVNAVQNVLEAKAGVTLLGTTSNVQPATPPVTPAVPATPDVSPSPPRGPP